MFSFLAQLLLYNKCFTTALVFKWKEFWGWNLTEDDVLTMCGRHGNNMWMTWDDPWGVEWSYVIPRSSACNPHGFGSFSHLHVILIQWLIQDFLQGGAPTPRLGLFCKFFAENCMKMKEFGPRGARVNGAPLDPPMSSSLVWDDIGDNICHPHGLTGGGVKLFTECIHWR